MKRIKNYIDNFIIPEPIFELRLTDSGSSIQSSFIWDYSEVYGDLKDDEVFQLLKPIVAPSIEFDKQLCIFVLDKEYTLENFKRYLKNNLNNLMEDNLKLTKPARRKINDWLYSIKDEDMESTLVELYLYLKKQDNTLSSFRDHAMNVYLILQAMKEKHEQKR